MEHRSRYPLLVLSIAIYAVGDIAIRFLPVLNILPRNYAPAEVWKLQLFTVLANVARNIGFAAVLFSESRSLVWGLFGFVVGPIAAILYYVLPASHK